MATTSDHPGGDQLVERLFGAALGALELFSVFLGWRLDLYSALSGGVPLTSEELAEQRGIDRRYAQEWLEQQAAAGFVTVEGEDPRRFAVPKGYVDVFCDPESLSYVVPFAPMLAGIGGVLPELVDAYRTGAGVPYPRYGADFRDGQGAINRPTYHHQMADWVAALPDVAEQLRRPGGRIVDLGCGQGWSTIALARAFPDVEIVGVDDDAASIADAGRNVAAAQVTVRLQGSDAAAVGDTADLVCIFEALHDMARPVEVLAAARRMLNPGGAVLLVDERVGDAFHVPADEVERMMYGWSVLHCLPASRVEPGSAALGTVLRRPAVEDLATQAGYTRCTVLDVDNDFFRLYRLDP
jgi:SAM-dependent methyltransferase